MVNAREIARVTASVFLPTVAGIFAGVPAIEALVRSHRIADQFSAINLSIVALETVLIPAGYACGLWLARTRISSPTLGRKRRHVSAALVAVSLLGVVSIYTQGAPLSWIIAASFLAGVAAAILCFSRGGT